MRTSQNINEIFNEKSFVLLLQLNGYCSLKRQRNSLLYLYDNLIWLFFYCTALSDKWQS